MIFFETKGFQQKKNPRLLCWFKPNTMLGRITKNPRNPKKKESFWWYFPKLIHSFRSSVRGYLFGVFAHFLVDFFVHVSCGRPSGVYVFACMCVLFFSVRTKNLWWFLVLTQRFLVLIVVVVVIVLVLVVVFFWVYYSCSRINWWIFLTPEDFLCVWMCVCVCIYVRAFVLCLGSL